MKAADVFGMFDSVKLKCDFNGDDIHDWEIRLRKGKSGCVMDLGKQDNTVIVEFRIGKGMKGIDFTQVELDAETLELESKVGRRFSDPNPYLETALAIKAGIIK